MSITSRGRWAAAIATAVATAALLPGVVFGQTAQFSARMAGANEAPATGSAATGTFVATLDETAQTLAWTLTVPAITSTTQAHLHAGAPGANGAVVLPLFAAPTGSPASSITLSGTSRPADITGPLAGNWAGFVAALKSNGLYVNIHTSAFPGGEIRGQVGAGATPPAAPPVVPAAAPTTTAAPAPSKTGQAGLVGNSTSPALMLLLAAAAVVVVAGGRVLSDRRR